MGLLEKAKLFWDMGRSFRMPDGSELPDPRPLALPVGFEKPESIQSMIRRLVTDPAIRRELAESEHLESFDEADDFEIPDDPPISSPYEESFDPMHIASRDQEIRAGQVLDRPVEVKERARDLKVKFDAFRKAKSERPPEAPKA